MRTILKRQTSLNDADKPFVAVPVFPINPVWIDTPIVAKMARSTFFKNYRVYMLTSVAYMGSLLFGMLTHLELSLRSPR
jgi:hypothetical protein